jgi:hypothetical protein
MRKVRMERAKTVSHGVFDTLFLCLTIILIDFIDDHRADNHSPPSPCQWDDLNRPDDIQNLHQLADDIRRRHHTSVYMDADNDSIIHRLPSIHDLSIWRVRVKVCICSAFFVAEFIHVYVGWS